jgi:predicted protein tyrosine phosphatase
MVLAAALHRTIFRVFHFITYRLAADSHALEQVASHWRGVDTDSTFVSHHEEAASLRPGFTYIPYDQLRKTR